MAKNDGPPARHPMAVVARRTGVRADVIRAWEKRHRVVDPSRGGGNRRLYTDEDVQRLTLLRQAVAAGWPIGQVAPLDDEEIRNMLAAEPALPDRRPSRGAGPELFLERCVKDVAGLDEVRLQAHLEDATVELGRTGLLDEVIAPLIRVVGERCADGTLRIAMEHLATSVVGRVLGALGPAAAPGDSAPALVVTTPALQHHELGAILVAALGRIEGWRTTYLGPNLPAEEIAAAARHLGARAVALSLAFPRGDPRTAEEIVRLGRMISGKAKLLAGGAAADSYQVALDQAGARRLDDLPALRSYLRAVH